MKRIFLLAALLLPLPAFAQAPKEKKAEPKKPAEALVGLWLGKRTFGDETMTFTADGRVIMKHGAGEGMTMKYTIDTSKQPWQMDFNGVMKNVDVTVFTVFDFPQPDEFRMCAPSPDKDKRPDTNALQQSKLTLNRVTLAANGGIFQVVEASLKNLAGTWEAKDGNATVTLTLTEDGAYTTQVPEFTDKGKFSINVSKPPLTIDFLSGEGMGIKYSLFELTPEGDLRIGGSGTTPETRPKALEQGATLTLKRKAEAGKGK